MTAKLDGYNQQFTEARWSAPMGYASLLEDIVERLGSALAENSANSTLHAEATSILHELRGLLELATDPRLDLARELQSSKDHIGRLQVEVKGLKSRCSVLSAQIDELNDQKSAIRRERDALSKKCRDLSGTLDGIRTDLDRAEHYAKQRRKKPQGVLRGGTS
jgi:chromosome segregation ATPase